MSSSNDSHSSLQSELSPVRGPLKQPGVMNQLSPEQLSTANASSQAPQQLIKPGLGLPPVKPQISAGPITTPGIVNPVSEPGVLHELSAPQQGPVTLPGTMRPFAGPVSFAPGMTPGSEPGTPRVTRALTDAHSYSGMGSVQTGALVPARNTTQGLRQPVLIRGTGKKSTGLTPPPKGRRWLIHLAVTLVVICIAFVTLMAALPTGTNSPFSGISSDHSLSQMFQGQSNDGGLSLAQQAATVTAVTRDGYDPNGTGNSSSQSSPTYTGLPSAPPGSDAYDGFTYGQCTYWADLRYHQLTGYYVSWGGNAWQWAGGAAANGWIVSSMPHVPSIIVLQPGVQGAGGYGHVAVVESINADGSVNTSNWNWYANGGGWARLSYATFYPGRGVSFVWHP